MSDTGQLVTPERPEFDRRVRLALYERTISQGIPPSTAALAVDIGATPEEIAAVLERLATGKAIVLFPNTREVLMANPFSAVPTGFRVSADGGLWWGNCAWDALGVLACLRRDGVVEANCGDCGEPIRVDVRSGKATSKPARVVLHIGVPAHHWWDDIVFT